MGERPDDRNGDAFRQALRAVQARPGDRPVEVIPDVTWRPIHPPEVGAHSSLLAQTGTHLLHVVEMQEEYLEKQSEVFPVISWSVSLVDGSALEPLVGGPAPTVPVACARAETLWRALCGWKVT